MADLEGRKVSFSPVVQSPCHFEHEMTGKMLEVGVDIDALIGHGNGQHVRNVGCRPDDVHPTSLTSRADFPSCVVGGALNS